MSNSGLKIGILLVAIVLAASSARGQSRNLNRIITGAGVNLTSLRDKSMSPLIYSGAGVTGMVGFERIKASGSFHIGIRHDRNSITSSPENTAGYLGFALKNHTLYRLGEDPEDRLLLGWSNNNVLASYMQESYGNFGSRSYYFTSFGPAAAYRYTFSLFRQQFDLGLMADFQLIGFYLRPSYISGSPEGYLDPDNSDFKAFLRSIEPFFPGPAWNFGFDPEIRFGFGPGNAISLAYSFEYLRIKNPEPVAEARGTWTVKIMTALWRSN